ncbi:MAG: transporter suffix domain-containing protein [Deltaproteobacteria bacterium]|nr:transporter suffix domain-containing protein [Deltaproteobacteria bacterium]
MEQKEMATAQPPRGWRFPVGLAILIVGFISPVFIPLVTASSLSTAWKTALSGLLAAGIPEIFSVVAIAIMGKSGFNYIKGRLFAFLRKHGPPDVVSRTRYHVGLVMFALPLLFGWLAPYAPHLIPVNLLGDIVFVSSLFILGGDFWDKVRALFTHEARVHMPA